MYRQIVIHPVNKCFSKFFLFIYFLRYKVIYMIPILAFLTFPQHASSMMQVHDADLKIKESQKTCPAGHVVF